MRMELHNSLQATAGSITSCISNFMIGTPNIFGHNPRPAARPPSTRRCDAEHGARRTFVGRFSGRYAAREGVARGLQCRQQTTEPMLPNPERELVLTMKTFRFK